MTKIIGICLLILGGILFINSTFQFITYLTTTKAERNDKWIQEEKEKGNDTAGLEEFLKSTEKESGPFEIILPIVVILIQGGMAYIGLALYRKSLNSIPIPKNSDFGKLIKKQNKTLLTGVITSITLLLIFLYLLSSTENPLFFFLAFCSFFGVIYFVREVIFFNYNFSDARSHLVSWEYPNGDKLIVTCWGIMKKNSSAPKLSMSSKFEGFRWNIDNAKDLAESLIKNEGNPLMTLLPSIEFSTTTNQIDDYIPFSFVDNINLTFIEKDSGYLIINIEKKNYNTKYTLTYPLPPTKSSLKSEVNIFEERINKRRTPVRGVYFEKSLVDEALKEEK